MKESHRKIVDDLFTTKSIEMTEQGEINPIYILILPGDQILPVVLSTEGIGMIQYSEAVRLIAKDIDAEAVVLVCEQYMVSKPKDSPEANALLSGQIKPSDHPDKEEYLTLMYVDAVGKCDSLISKVHSDPLGTRYTTDSRWIENSSTNMIRPWKE